MFLLTHILADQNWYTFTRPFCYLFRNFHVYHQILLRVILIFTVVVWGLCLRRWWLLLCVVYMHLHCSNSLYKWHGHISQRYCRCWPPNELMIRSGFSVQIFVWTLVYCSTTTDWTSSVSLGVYLTTGVTLKGLLVMWQRLFICTLTKLIRFAVIMFDLCSTFISACLILIRWFLWLKVMMLFVTEPCFSVVLLIKTFNLFCFITRENVVVDGYYIYCCDLFILIIIWMWEMASWIWFLQYVFHFDHS